MTAFLKCFLSVAVVMLGLSGCYMNQVRHLAADVALVQVGKSTREDVTVFLGEPDDRGQDREGREVWHYSEKDTSLLEKTPVLGKTFGSPEFTHVVVTFSDGVVVSCNFSQSDADDLSWAKDFSWQETGK